MKYLVLLILLFAFTSCKKNSNATPYPFCVQAAIDSAMSKPRGSLYARIDAYTYQNKRVYLYLSGGGDLYNTLKDENCTLMFYPSGGITGGGDMTHPGFFSDAVFIKTIWTDPRP